MAKTYPFKTLPDYLATGLDLVLIGINPGLYSVERGHYFARASSRFWPAFSRSKLSERVRRGLEVDMLRPEHDWELVRFGIGLTDVVKVPSANAAGLSPKDYEEWAPRLVSKIRRYRPRVACFHGLTAYRPFLKYGLGRDGVPALGEQAERIGETKLYVVPNPSPANAHFNVLEQAKWYDRLAEFVRLDVRNS